jgi:hypothetical protein
MLQQEATSYLIAVLDQQGPPWPDVACLMGALTRLALVALGA